VTVNQFLDYFTNNSVCIDIYDGRSAESNKLTYWYGRDRFHPHHFEALTSSSDALFINYTARGGPVDLHMDILYYLCGGKVDPGLKIGSPIFDRNTTYEVPDALECTWILEKPKHISYGLLQFYSIHVPDCLTLAVGTDSGSLISVYDTDAINNGKFEMNNPNKTDKFADARKEFLHTLFELNQNSTEASGTEINVTSHGGYEYDTYKTIEVIQVCNSTEKKYGFTARFQFLQLPKQFLQPPNATPKPSSDNAVRNWFINYGALVFCSVGILIGCIIMYFQARRWSKNGNRRSYVSGNTRNRATASRNTRTKLYSNSEHGPLVQPVYTSGHKLVELREIFLSEEEEKIDFVEEPFQPDGLSKQNRKIPTRALTCLLDEQAKSKHFNQPYVLSHKRTVSDSEILPNRLKVIKFSVG